MKFRRILSGVLSVLCIGTSSVIGVSAEDTVTGSAYEDGYLSYYVADSESDGVVDYGIVTGTFTVTPLSDVTIPAEVYYEIDSMEEGEGYNIPIIGVELGAFIGERRLQTLTVSEGVKSLGIYMCRDVTTLETVHLPSTVTRIPDGAFTGCTSLKSINLDAITEIGGNAFSSSGFEQIVIGKSVNSIGSSAFDNCDMLYEITILNPECEIAETAISEDYTGVVYGYAGSTAETYCAEHNLTFKAFSERPAYDATKVWYGDVNLDGVVNVADVVSVNMYCLDDVKNAITDATAVENADCMYDGNIDSADASLILSYVSEMIEHEKLGREDKTGLSKYN